jgi:hypothetical protein
VRLSLRLISSCLFDSPQFERVLKKRVQLAPKITGAHQEVNGIPGKAYFQRSVSLTLRAGDMLPPKHQS